MKSQLLFLCKQRFVCPHRVASHACPYCTEANSEEKKSSYKSWRKPWAQREGEWYSKFSMFAPEKGGSPDLVRIMQSKIDLRPTTLQKWWKGMKKEASVLDMRYIPERHQILGSDLAASHFLVHRGASVRFVGSSTWIKREGDEYHLPDRYDPSYEIEAIDASTMKYFYYEGFRNMTNLKKLKWLSLQNLEEIDDWCLDKISGEYQSSLEYLDISNCSQVTDRGIGALYRMSELRTLKVFNIANNPLFQLACLMLQDLHPQLKIEGVKYLEVDEKSV